MPRAAARKTAVPRPPAVSAVADWALALVRETALKPLSTLEHLREQYRDDFVGFCTLVRIQHAQSGQPVPLTLTPIQVEINARRTGRDVWLKSRQIYATTLELARDVWFWLTKPGVQVRVVCQTIKDRSIFNDLSKRIGLMLESLVDAGLYIPLASVTTGRWMLSARAGAATLELMEAGAAKQSAGNVGRGGTTQRLHCTEIAAWHLAATTLRSIMPTVHGRAGDGTEVTFESTPNGVSVDGAGDAFDAAGGPYFHLQWQRAVDGTSGYTAHFVPWYRHHEYRTPLDADEVIDPEQNPIAERRAREQQLVDAGVTPEQLKWYRQTVAEKGQNTTDQEFPSDPDSCFLLSGRSFFDKDVTIALLAEARKTPPRETRIMRAGASGWLKVWKPRVAGHRYLVAGDTSSGEGGDPGVLHVYDWSAMGEHVATLHGQFRPIELARFAAALGLAYRSNDGPAPVCIERNNHGSAVLQELMRVGALVDVLGPDAHRDLVTVVAASATPEHLAELRAWAAPTAPFGQRAAPAPAYPAVWADYDGKAGWWTGAVSRADGLALLEQDHREGRWRTPDVALLDEMRTFVVQDGRAAGATGKHDDAVMCAMIGHAVMSRAPLPGTTRLVGNMPPA